MLAQSADNSAKPSAPAEQPPAAASTDSAAPPQGQQGGQTTAQLLRQTEGPAPRLPGEIAMLGTVRAAGAKPQQWRILVPVAKAKKRPAKGPYDVVLQEASAGKPPPGKRQKVCETS